MENYIDKIKKGDAEYDFRDTTSGYATTGEVSEAVGSKQDILIAGQNIHIAEDGKTISADGVTVAQTTGQSTTTVMSQKAVTDLIGNVETALSNI